MPEPVRSGRRRRRSRLRGRIRRTLRVLVPFLVLLAATLLSAGVIQVVESGSSMSAAERKAYRPPQLAPLIPAATGPSRPKGNRWPARPPLLPAAPGSDADDILLTPGPQQSQPPVETGFLAPGPPPVGGLDELPSVEARPAVLAGADSSPAALRAVPEPKSGLLVSAGLALLAHARSSR